MDVPQKFSTDEGREVEGDAFCLAVPFKTVGVLLIG